MDSNTLHETSSNRGGGSPNSGMMYSHLSQRNTFSEEQVKVRNDYRKRHKIDSEGSSSISEVKKILKSCHEVINLILDEKPLKLCYDDYCRSIYTLCRIAPWQQGRLSDYMTERIDGTFNANFKDKFIKAIYDESYMLTERVTEYLRIYDSWYQILLTLSKVFVYLDRGYLKPHEKRQVILESGLSTFVDQLLSRTSQKVDGYSETPSERTLALYVSLLNATRDTQDQDMLVSLKQFSVVLQGLNFKNNINLNSTIKNSTIAYYRNKSVVLLTDPKSCLQCIFKHISTEISFFTDCKFDKDFLKDLQLRLKWVLLFNDFGTILGICLPEIVENNQINTFKLINDLSLTALTDYEYNAKATFLFEWGVYCSKRFDEVINSNLTDVVSLLVKVYHELESITSSAEGTEDFEYEKRRALQKSINKKIINGKIIQHLIKYCDSFFKANPKKLNKPEGNNLSYEGFEDAVLLIFKAINNKNTFLESYSRDLSKRLLLGKNTHQGLEKKLISKFTQVVGETDETICLQMMFKDIAISKDMYSDSELGASFGFNAYILQQKYWPEVPNTDSQLILPSEFERTLEKFMLKYYKCNERNKEHKLDWSHYSLHQVTLNVEFEQGFKELNVNLLQALVLWKFNQGDSYTYEELQAFTNMNDRNLQRCIASLSSSKYSILINKEGVYHFNYKFESKSNKIRIPVPRDRDSEGRVESHIGISERRTAEIRCLIIRLIKSSREVTFIELLDDALEKASCKGPCEVSDIKKNIEYLIDNDYISRDSETSILKYVP